jgi:hypothetical protein
LTGTMQNDEGGRPESPRGCITHLGRACGRTNSEWILSRGWRRRCAPSRVTVKHGLTGSRLSEFDPSKLFVATLVDQARKHRKRPPDEVAKRACNKTSEPKGWPPRSFQVHCGISPPCATNEIERIVDRMAVPPAAELNKGHIHAAREDPRSETRSQPARAGVVSPWSGRTIGNPG